MRLMLQLAVRSTIKLGCHKMEPCSSPPLPSFFSPSPLLLLLLLSFFHFLYSPPSPSIFLHPPPPSSVHPPPLPSSMYPPPSSCTLPPPPCTLPPPQDVYACERDESSVVSTLDRCVEYTRQTEAPYTRYSQPCCAERVYMTMKTMMGSS